VHVAWHVCFTGPIRKSGGRRGASVGANAPVSSGPLGIIGMAVNADMDAREGGPSGINTHE
jgi:hypothetical protein